MQVTAPALRLNVVGVDMITGIDVHGGKSDIFAVLAHGIANRDGPRRNLVPENNVPGHGQDQTHTNSIRNRDDLTGHQVNKGDGDIVVRVQDIDLPRCPVGSNRRCPVSLAIHLDVLSSSPRLHPVRSPMISPDGVRLTSGTDPYRLFEPGEIR